MGGLIKGIMYDPARRRRASALEVTSIRVQLRQAVEHKGKALMPGFALKTGPVVEARSVMQEEALKEIATVACDGSLQLIKDLEMCLLNVCATGRGSVQA